MNIGSVGPVDDWPCPTCGGGLPDGRPGQKICRCGLLWSWGAHPGPEEWRLIRHLLACRSDHHCERCGVRLGAGEEATVHHRDPKQAGGTSDPAVNDLSNIVVLCGGKLGGVLGCHGDIESSRERAYESGWLVHTGTDPATVPITLAGGRRVLLARDVPEYLPPPDGIRYDLHYIPHPPKRQAS